MSEVISSQREGVYLCQHCEKGFKAEKYLNVTCPHCGKSQIDTAQWQKVMVRRTHQVSFETEEEIEFSNHRKEQDLHLDMFGRRKAIRRLFFIVMGILWIAGIGFIVFKKVYKEEKPIVSNGNSVSAEELKFDRNFRVSTWQILNPFLNNSPQVSRAQYVINPKVDQLQNYFLAGVNQIPTQPVKIKSIQNFDQYVEATVAFKEGPDAEFIFVKEGNRFLIDWDHFANQGSMNFDRFVREEPNEEHTFRVYYTYETSGSSLELNFINANRHNLAFNRDQATSLRIKIPPTDPLYSQAETLIDTNKKLKIYNSTLSPKTQTIMRQNDPHGYFRANITLKWDIVEGRRKPILVKINSAHWLGEHYTEMFSPTQKLTNAKR